VVRGSRFGLAVDPRGMDLTLADKGRSSRIRMSYVGSKGGSALAAENRLAGVSNYYRGRDPKRWRTGVPRFARVVSPEVYPGVDAVYYGRAGRLEYDLHVRPGADPGGIRLRFSGASGVRRDASGNLVVATNAGDVVQHKPVAYQSGARGLEPVEAAFELCTDVPGDVEFRLGRFDRSRELVIDPVLVFSTLLGGGVRDSVHKSSADSPHGLAVRSDGSVYVGGFTYAADFPMVNPSDASYGGGNDGDMFVARLNPQGTDLLFSTYLGSNDQCLDLAVDPDGNAVLCGEVRGADFPTTPGAYQPDFGGGNLDGVVAKLSESGALLYGTFLGGPGDDQLYGIDVDGDGSAYVVGAAHAGYPVTAGAFQRTLGGFADGCVSKLDSTGSALVFSTFLGGAALETAVAVAVDARGQAAVATSTFSDDFPTTAGASQTSRVGASGTVAFSRLNSTGSRLIYSTYLSGSGSDSVTAVVLDNAASAYVVGLTTSLDFPTSPGSFQTAGRGSFDCFATKFTAGGAVAYSAVFGTTGIDYPFDAVVNGAGELTLGGATNSAAFPVTPDALDGVITGPADCFVSTLDARGMELLYSSFLGGAGSDQVARLALGRDGRLIVAGVTDDSSFPTTPGCYQSTVKGDTDGFVTAMEIDQGPTELSLQAVSPTRILATWINHCPNVAKFRIELSTNGGVTWSGVKSLTQSPAAGDPVSAVLTGLLPGTQYTVRVRALRTTGTYTTYNWNGPQTATTQPAPAAPSDLAATVLSTTRVRVDFVNQASNQAGFKVERSDNGGTSYVVAKTLVSTAAPGTPFTVTLTSLAPGTSYLFRVRAYLEGTYSAYAGPVEATTQGPPAAPSNLVATRLTSTSVRLTFTNNATNALRFRLSESTDGGTTYPTVVYRANTLGPGATFTWTRTGLTPGTTYTWVVQAVNDSTLSAPSEPASATP
jgi:hypothetical protein